MISGYDDGSKQFPEFFLFSLIKISNFLEKGIIKSLLPKMSQYSPYFIKFYCFLGYIFIIFWFFFFQKIKASFDSELKLIGSLVKTPKIVSSFSLVKINKLPLFFVESIKLCPFSSENISSDLISVFLKIELKSGALFK